jgi:hypothetical protein
MGMLADDQKAVWEFHRPVLTLLTRVWQQKGKELLATCVFITKTNPAEL